MKFIKKLFFGYRQTLINKIINLNKHESFLFRFQKQSITVLFHCNYVLK